MEKVLIALLSLQVLSYLAGRLAEFLKLTNL